MSVEKIILNDNQKKIVEDAKILPKFENEVKGFTVSLKSGIQDQTQHNPNMYRGKYRQTEPNSSFHIKKMQPRDARRYPQASARFDELLVDPKHNHALMKLLQRGYNTFLK